MRTRRVNPGSRASYAPAATIAIYIMHLPVPHTHGTRHVQNHAPGKEVENESWDSAARAVS